MRMGLSPVCDVESRWDEAPVVGSIPVPDWLPRLADYGWFLLRLRQEGLAMALADEKAVPLLALDLDGTVRKGKDELGRFVNGPEDVEVFPEAIEMMRRWKKGGGRIVGVSNQGGIALGLVSMAKVTAAMVETHRQAEELFDKIAWCSHFPTADHPEMARCWCRKPSPGLLIETALELAREHNEYYPPYMGVFVGDRPEDEECARLAGFDFEWAADWRARAES